MSFEGENQKLELMKWIHV